MEFKTSKWGGVSFQVPDQPTVHQILVHDSRRYEMDGAPALVVLWEMAKPTITGWQSEAMPDKDADLAQLTDPRQARIVEWAALNVSAWRRGLDLVPKNSSGRRSQRPEKS